MSEKEFDEVENIIPDDNCEFAKLILKLDDSAIQKALGELDYYYFSTSLKNQSQNVRKRIFDNISKESALMIEEHINYINPDQEMIDENQKKIIDFITKEQQ